MRWLAVIAMCGCNSWFGLDQAELPDSAVAPTPRCPDIGSNTVPRFADDLHQIPAQFCEGYAVGGDSAMAECNGVPSRGPIDKALDQVMDGTTANYPRISPDGTRAILSSYNPVTYTNDIVEYEFTPAGPVQVRSFTPDPPSYYYGYQYSTPSAGPDHRIVYLAYTYELVELSDASGQWMLKQRYPLSELGMSLYDMDQPALSPDGLRLVFVSSGPVRQPEPPNGAGEGVPPPDPTYQAPVMYAERKSLEDHFGTAVVLDSVPDLVQWPYMTADCGRIYFSALNRVFYLEQAY